MSPHFLTRRELSVRLMSLLSAVGLVGSAAALSDASSADDEISRNCESIHQEVEFKASPARVYKALTDGKQFSKVVDFVMPGASTVISPEVGGTFSMFGGVITGRHIEMAPNELLVQAWREKDWEPGVYSIVRFQLSGDASHTKLVFDHTGFPTGNAYHLAPGWKSHYWEPLKKFLA
jgi:activator of HSP90 ATPase